MVKRILSIAMIFIVIISLVGCTNMKFTESGDSLVAKEIPEDGYTKIFADWLIYGNAQEVIDSADLVFIAKVIDIEFQVLDSRNSLPVSDETPDVDRSLHTIYNIDIMETYKGNTTSVEQVRVMGGRVDYKVDEQIKIMTENKAYRYQAGIPIIENFYKTELNENGYYLFALRQSELGCPTVLNMDQSIYSLEEPTRKNTIGDNTKAYYNGSTDEYNYPLISAYDIVCEFGEENTFYENYKAGKYISE